MAAPAAPSPTPAINRRWLAVMIASLVAVIGGVEGYWVLSHPSLPRFDPRKGGLQLVYEVAIPDGMKDSKALLADEQRVMGERLRRMKLCDPVFAVDGNKLSVRLPPLAPDAFEHVRELLQRQARLEFLEIDDGQALADAASKLPSPVRAEADRWMGMDDRAERQARYLRATSEAEAGALGVAIAPSLPPGISLATERIERRHDFGEAARATEWHVYAVRQPAEVTSADIGDAAVSYDAQTGRPYAAVTFTPRGAQAFAALTRRIVDRKLAIVLDGKIMSAPVVMSEISGGRAQITLGGSKDPEALLEDAKDLVAVLSVGALPAPVRLLSEQRLDPQK